MDFLGFGGQKGPVRDFSVCSNKLLPVPSLYFLKAGLATTIQCIHENKSTCGKFLHQNVQKLTRKNVQNKNGSL